MYRSCPVLRLAYVVVLAFDDHLTITGCPRVFYGHIQEYLPDAAVLIAVRYPDVPKDAGVAAALQHMHAVRCSGDGQRADRDASVKGHVKTLAGDVEVLLVFGSSFVLAQILHEGGQRARAFPPAGNRPIPCQAAVPGTRSAPRHSERRCHKGRGRSCPSRGV